MNKFFHLSSDSGDTATSSGLGDNVDSVFESLQQKCWERTDQMEVKPNPQMQPKDSISNVSTAFSGRVVSFLNRVDLELQREELQIQAKKGTTQIGSPGRI